MILSRGAPGCPPARHGASGAVARLCSVSSPESVPSRAEPNVPSGKSGKSPHFATPTPLTPHLFLQSWLRPGQR